MNYSVPVFSWPSELSLSGGRWDFSCKYFCFHELKIHRATGCSLPLPLGFQEYLLVVLKSTVLILPDLSSEKKERDHITFNVHVSVEVERGMSPAGANNIKSSWDLYDATKGRFFQNVFPLYRRWIGKTPFTERTFF